MNSAAKAEQYEQLVGELHGLMADERDWLANLANAAALLWLRLPDLNWAGFYLFRARRLTVGPFQGKPACVHIELSRGVCGAAASQRKTIVVPDVHQFPGHIACDDASKSEIVVPLIGADGRLLGVLDLDSPRLARFDDVDARGLEKFAAALIAATDWPAEIP